MRHNYKGRKLGTDPSHTKAMKRSLTAALLYNDRIKTIESRAKEIRPEVDRIITWAKKGDLHSRRLAIARLGGGEDNKEIVREIFEKVEQGMFADRQGGYTRIMKLGPRKGDGAPMVIMELCTEPVKKKEKATAEPKKAAKAKKAEKVEEVAEEVEAVEEAEVVEAEAEVVEAEAVEAEEAVEEVAEEAAEEAPEAAEEAAEEAEEKAE
jgi:large subunit ribosomal protein L17